MAIGAAVLALSALGALYILRPDLDPSWHLVSEYAIGPHHWLLVVYFLALSAGSAILSVALKPQVRTRTGWIGVVLLFLSALLLAQAAVLSASARWTQVEARPSSGLMLRLSSVIEVPGVLGMLLLSLALRKRALWIDAPLLGLAMVAWISFGVMVASPLVAREPLTADGPGIMGLANRALIAAYGLWLMSAAWPLARARTRRP